MRSNIALQDTRASAAATEKNGKFVRFLNNLDNTQ
jgi:hypothetical protein